ncbi:MAG: ABC transporter substrate-binding protein [Rhizobiales bacterium]|nr:ABC transporter substrate-binding protein [Hyphomicrobiales bacterium]
MHGLLRALLVGAATCMALVNTGVRNVAHAEDRIPVNIGFYPGATFQTLIFVAQAKGFYEKAGLEPTFISTANGPLMNSELASGAIDVGFNAPSQIGLAREQGLDLIFVAGNANIPWVLITRPDVKLPHKGKYPEMIGDMKGLVWGVYGRGSDGEVFMRMMAKDAGLNVDKDVTWVGVGGPATGLPALQVGKIQVYMTLDPAPIIASSGGYGQTVMDLRKGEGPEDLKGIIYQGIEAKRSTVEKKPEIFARTIKAHEMAYCWVNNPANFKELVSLLKSKLPSQGLTDEQFSNMIKENIPTLTLTFPLDQLERWNKLLVANGVLKAPLEADKLFWKDMPTKNPTCG